MYTPSVCKDNLSHENICGAIIVVKVLLQKWGGKPIFFLQKFAVFFLDPVLKQMPLLICIQKLRYLPVYGIINPDVGSDPITKSQNKRHQILFINLFVFINQIPCSVQSQFQPDVNM